MTDVGLFDAFVPAPSCVLSGDGGGHDGLGSYRYTLRIPIAAKGITVLFVLANPSTARVVDGHFGPDPTVTRCLGYGRGLGARVVIVENARAWRETNPKLVPPDPQAIGPENDARILASAEESDLVICGWGKLGGKRGLDVLRLLAPHKPHALKLTKAGEPGHPLYLPASARPFLLSERFRQGVAS